MELINNYLVPNEKTNWVRWERVCIVFESSPMTFARSSNGGVKIDARRKRMKKESWEGKVKNRFREVWKLVTTFIFPLLL